MLATAWHYPFLVVAGLLLGIAAALLVRLHLKLASVGERSYELFSIPNGFMAFAVPKAYLKLCGRYGWPPWPAYGIWLCILLAVLFGIVGVVQM